MTGKGLSGEEIPRIAQAVGFLPDDVKAAYAAGDGLRGPTDIWLLWPSADIARNNEIKSEDWFPEALRNFTLIGDDGCGGLICVTSGIAGLWYPADGAEFHEQRGSATEIWELIRHLYAKTAGG
jgi:hypothetical protein